jgi:hypothetical protein
MNDRVADAVQTIAEQYSSIDWGDVPAPVRDRALMVLVDTLSLMIVGAADALQSSCVLPAVPE